MLLGISAGYWPFEWADLCRGPPSVPTCGLWSSRTFSLTELSHGFGGRDIERGGIVLGGQTILSLGAASQVMAVSSQIDGGRRHWIAAFYSDQFLILWSRRAGILMHPSYHVVLTT